jgi:hypothetical protein
MNLRQLVLSQPKLLAGGAGAALAVGLGFGWLAHAPIDRAMANPTSRPAPAIAPSLTIDRTAPPGDGLASAPITAAVYPSADAITGPPRPRVARQDSVPAFSDEQPTAYDETQGPREAAEDRDQQRAPDYPPPPPPPEGPDETY